MLDTIEWDGWVSHAISLPILMMQSKNSRDQLQDKLKKIALIKNAKKVSQRFSEKTLIGNFIKEPDRADPR